MGEQGSVAWMFERKSQIFVPAEKIGEDALMGIVLDAGADDLRNEGERWEILSAPEAHESVLKALESNSIPHEDAAIAMVPKNLIRLEGKNASGMMRLNDALEDHDDVQSVYSNFDIDEKELEALAQ
jgi:transcriptional/translational regulatory protein YebC/TACO1